jgi:hypothetical protein
MRSAILCLSFSLQGSLPSALRHVILAMYAIRKISGLMDKYQSEITKANDAFAHENVSVVKVVYTDGKHFPREYFPGYFYTDAGARYQNWESWRAVVNTAVNNYSIEAKAAYNNACLLW